MEKVRLTKAQAEAVDYFKETFVKNKETFMSNETLRKALRNGYEVEPEFKSGDWIVYENEYHKCVMQITDTDKHYVYVEPSHNGFKDCTAISKKSSLIRHATPSEIAEEKERRFFARHGREPWEIREDDLLVYLSDLYIIDCFDSEKVCLKRGKNSISNYEEPFDYVKNHFTIVCFADDRKDLG